MKRFNGAAGIHDADCPLHRAFLGKRRENQTDRHALCVPDSAGHGGRGKAGFPECEDRRLQSGSGADEFHDHGGHAKALGYPMLINLYAYSDMQQAIGVVSENFDGLQILRDRENAAECIRKTIDAGVDDLVRVGYLQTLASYVADETRGTGFLKRSQTAVGAERRWLYFFEKR